MVAIGRALMANPQLLLCDEISFGLAPVIIKEITDRNDRFCSYCADFSPISVPGICFCWERLRLSIIVTLTMPKGIAGLLAERFDLELSPPRRRVRLPKQKSNHSNALCFG